MINNTYYLHEGRTDVSLKTYVINEAGEMNTQGARPAVLILPGGAYLNCSDREAEPIALRFAAMGYHAFVLRYSTYGEGKPGFPEEIFQPEFEVKPHLAHPAPVMEVAMAMQMIADHAKEWCVDTEKIAICGFSAGSHNAAMYGVYWNKEPINGVKPAALILAYPLTDYLMMKVADQNDMMKMFFKRSTSAFLGKKIWTDEELILVSPALLVDENTPPTFLWATAKDGMVPVQQSLRMSQALADHKIPFELHVFEEGDHGLALADQSTAMAYEQINADAAQWVGLAERWLAKRFALQLPERLPGFENSVV